MTKKINAPGQRMGYDLYILFLAPLRAHWLVQIDEPSKAEVSCSSIASIRLRAATALYGQVQVSDEISYGWKLDKIPDILLVGKIGDGCQNNGLSDLWVKYIEEARTRGLPVIIDYTDNHLEANNQMTLFYQKLSNQFSNSLIWITPSPWMSDRLRMHGMQHIFLIDDAIEVATRHFRKVSNDNDIPTFLWFGDVSNLGHLISFLESAKSTKSFKLNLNIISNPQVEKLLPDISCLRSANFSPWSISNLLNASKLSDICLIPGDQSNLYKAGVGINRLATSLALGLPTFATAYSSYRQLSEYYADIQDFNLNNYHSLMPYLSQDMDAPLFSKLKRFSLYNIGNKWLQRMRSSCAQDLQ